MAAGSMPWRRVLGAYLAEVHGELLHAIRSPQMVVFTMLFPVMFYLLAGFVFGPFHHPDTHVRTYVLIGFIIMATMTAGLSPFAGPLPVERETRLFALRRALPMPIGADIAAKMVTALLCLAAVVPVLMALGLLFGNVELSPGNMTVIGALALGGAVPFCGVGFLIGVHASARAVPAVVNLVMIPMLYLSGALFPLPEGVAWMRYFMPPFYLQQLMLAAAGLPAQFVISPFAHAAALLGMVIACVALSLRRFRLIA
jgi:ABC-2 type transport system permease protein